MRRAPEGTRSDAVKKNFRPFEIIYEASVTTAVLSKYLVVAH